MFVQDHMYCRFHSKIQDSSSPHEFRHTLLQFAVVFLSVRSVNLTPILLKNFFCTLYFVKLSPSFIRRAGPSFSETVPNLHPAALRILFLLGFVALFNSAPCCLTASSAVFPDKFILSLSLNLTRFFFSGEVAWVDARFAWLCNLLEN